MDFYGGKLERVFVFGLDIRYILVDRGYCFVVFKICFVQCDDFGLFLYGVYKIQCQVCVGIFMVNNNRN